MKVKEALKKLDSNVNSVFVLEYWTDANGATTHLLKRTESGFLPQVKEELREQMKNHIENLTVRKTTTERTGEIWIDAYFRYGRARK